MATKWDAVVAAVEGSLSGDWRVLDRGAALVVFTNDHVVDGFGTNIVVQQFEESFPSTFSNGVASVDLGQSSIGDVFHEMLTVGRNSHSGTSVSRYLAWLKAADSVTVRVVASTDTGSVGLLAPVIESLAMSIRQIEGVVE